MIIEKEAAQYLDIPVRVRLSDGNTFEGVYWDWQLDVSADVSSAMLFNPLDGRDLYGGHVLIEAVKIACVEPIYDQHVTTCQARPSESCSPHTRG